MKRNFVINMLGGFVGIFLTLLVVNFTDNANALSVDRPAVMSQSPTPIVNAPAAVPISTTFTYQGQLKNRGVPVTGSCGMAFRLHDDPSAGNLIGSPITLTVPIVNGLFTVQLNDGSAVAGVVNVILRKNYTGASIGASYGQTGKSDGQTTRAYGSFGAGNLDTDKYNVFFTVEAAKTDNIWSKDRGFIGQGDLRSLGYFNVLNGANRPYFGLGPSSNSAYGVTRNANGGGARVNVIPCPGNTDPAK